jgi:hypothetical protein
MLKKYVVYLGINEPETIEEVKVEISGLNHAIKIAEESIARLEQALAIVELEKTKGSVENGQQRKSNIQTPSTEAKKGPKESEAISGEV